MTSTKRSVLLLKTKLRLHSLKRKIKKLTINRENFWINFIIVIAILSILIGITVFVVFLMKLSAQYSITGNAIDIKTTSQVGSFIGGVVGAIWALTGVLLFYAALRLQSRELRENRIHFQLSRLTEIIYNQISIINNQFENFKLKDIERNSKGKFKKYKGRTAVALLRRRVESIIEIQKRVEASGNKKAIEEFFIEQVAFIEINKKALLNIYEEISNHVDTIRAVLIKEDIPPTDLNELKAIFFRNVGKDFLNSSELLLPFIDRYIDIKKKTQDDYEILWAIEHSLKLKIQVVKEFRDIQYDRRTIKDYLSHREMYNMHKF